MAQAAGIDTKDGLPVLGFESAEAWQAWLQEHHLSSRGLWLRIARKPSGLDSVSYAEALEIALCHGWIDGQKGSYDDRFWLQKFTPRGPRSPWSAVNREKALALISSGRMAPAGMAAIEQAQRDGRWERAYAGQRTAAVPDDLQKALDARAAAAAFFATLDSRNRYAVLYRIQDAKKPDTRARRIESFVAMLERGEKVYP